jgi:hypothetical protein
MSMGRSFCLVFITSFTITLLSACKKDVEGCTLSAASNYNSEANIDNGTCLFMASVVFYHNEATANYLNSLDYGDDLAILKYCVSGVEYFISSVFTGFSNSPVCGATGTITLQINLGIAAKSVEFNIKDQWGTSVWNDWVFMVTNQCAPVELSF